MHAANECFWRNCKIKYSSHLDNPNSRRLEVGSYNINGSLRQLLGRHKEHVGVDFRPGPCVDVVSFAHEMSFDSKFDAVISASMLEHDPYWESSIANMISCLKDDGILIMSWGAAGNLPHGEEYAADGNNEFYSLPAGKVFKLLKSLGIYIHKFHYECNFVKHQWGQPLMPPVVGGIGEVVLVAFRHKKYAVDHRREIDELIVDDDI
jgi:SAM-dependent methyltransferase